MINVSAELFRVVASAQSDATTRYYLHGVHIEPHHEGVLMIATNGQVMLVAHDPQGDSDRERHTVMLSKDALKMAKKAERLVIDPVLKSVEIETTRTACDILDGSSFPQWRNVVGLYKDGETVTQSFAPKYMRLFADITKELGSAAFAIISNAPESPALVRFRSREDIFGIIMPVRDDTSRKLPGFF